MTSSRILLFTGKGGTGKTTVAAATGLLAADRGHRVLVMSADPAHSLADAFDKQIGPEPVPMAPNLWAQEVDVYYSVQKYWGQLRDFILQVLRWQKVNEIMAEEIAALPGMEEGAAFLWVEQFYNSGEFDTIIIDSAPTGETLTLLALPQVGQWWMERIFPLQRRVAKTFGPFVRAVTGMPIPADQTYAEVEDLYEKLLEIHTVLADPEVSSIRLVMNPERMVIQEARRAYSSLLLYGYPVDAAVVNRVLPQESVDPMFQQYVAAQKGYLKEIEDAFAPLPILQIPHLGREVFQMPLLREIGQKLYGDRDPTEIFFKEKPYKLTPEDGSYLLEVHLPFLSKEDVSVLQYGDEMVIQAKSQRRNFFLPKFLAYYNATDAKLEEGWLRVRFESPPAEEGAGEKRR